MKYKVLSVVFGTAAVFASSAWAECPAKAPIVKWNVQAGDQRVSGNYLNDLLSGHKVQFDYGAYEQYRAGGSYRYKDSTGTYDSGEIRFYGDGVRCIGYPDYPRFDLYVVNDGKLVLINAEGGRFVTRITN